MVPMQSQSYMYISNAEEVVVTLGTPQWYPGNLNPYMYISNAEGVVVTQVLPNGTHAISILYVH